MKTKKQASRKAIRTWFRNPDGSCVQCSIGMCGVDQNVPEAATLLWDTEYGKRERGGSGPSRVSDYRLLAEHLTSEYRVKTEGRGRTVDEWKLRPERGDNHWFDCLVGAAVAASMQGAVLIGTDVESARKRERVSFADLQKRRRS